VTATHQGIAYSLIIDPKAWLSYFRLQTHRNSMELCLFIEKEREEEREGGRKLRSKCYTGH
jgi:hypothetical protein